MWTQTGLALLSLGVGAGSVQAAPVPSSVTARQPLLIRALEPAEPCRGRTVVSTKPTPPYLAVSICAEREPSTAPGGMLTSFSLRVRTAAGWYSAALGEAGVVGGFSGYFVRAFSDPRLALTQVVPGGAPEIVIRFSDGSESLTVCGAGPSGTLSCAAAAITGSSQRGRWSYDPANRTSQYLVGHAILYSQVLLFP